MKQQDEAVPEESVVPQQPMRETPKMTKNDFELLKTIGKGSFGKVFEVSIEFRSLFSRYDIKAMEKSMP